MSWMCKHEIIYDGSWENPPEHWCDLGYDSCENCDYAYSEEEFDADYADMLYDMYRDSLLGF